jgi:hypothetical protein
MLTLGVPLFALFLITSFRYKYPTDPKETLYYGEIYFMVFIMTMGYAVFRPKLNPVNITGLVLSTAIALVYHEISRRSDVVSYYQRKNNRNKMILINFNQWKKYTPASNDSDEDYDKLPETLKSADDSYNRLELQKLDPSAEEISGVETQFSIEDPKENNDEEK